MMHSFLRAYDHEDHGGRSRGDHSSRSQQPGPATPAGPQLAPGSAGTAGGDHSCRRERCQRVVINVSGELFETQLRTLDRYPDTLLGSEAKRLAHWDPTRCQYFFDRHRPSFPAILNFYQTGGRLRRPQEVPEDVFYDELKFFEFDRAVVREFLLSEGYASKTLNRLAGHGWRARLYATFEHPDSSLIARAVAIISVLAIVLSLVLFCIETLPAKASTRCHLGMRQYYQWQLMELGKLESVSTVTTVTTMPEMTTTTTAIAPRLDAHSRLLNWIFTLEALCVTWFCIEFFVRVLTYPYPRKALLFSITSWLDVASILPFIVSAVFMDHHAQCASQQCPRRSYLFKAFGFLRVFRVFKFHKYVTGMRILGRTLRMSFREMTMFLFFLTICIVLFSTAIYFAETGNDRLQFSSIPDSFWWAVISMCTVGYGDYVPRSVYGKMVGGICVVAGVMTIALPVPVIVTNFNTVYRQTVQRRVRPEVVEVKLIPAA